MKSITENTNRIGCFTSSEIYNLLAEGKTKGTIGKPCLTYISERNMERKLGRSLEVESNARPLVWGRVMESYCFNLLGTEYKLASQETITHPEIPYWSGSSDGNKFDEGKTVFDIKMPITLKSFCQLVEPLYKVPALEGIEAINYIRENHKDGEKYYWQLVSNAILTNSKYAELIVCVPYLSELETIREIVRNFDGNQNPLAWIVFAEDNELPYLKDNGFYKSLNVIRFEVPEVDKLNLKYKVLEAGKLLIDLK